MTKSYVIAQLQEENERLRAEVAALRQERKKVQPGSSKHDCLYLTIASVANLLLLAPDYTTTLPEVLQNLGEAASSDRCYLVENLTDPQTGKLALRIHTEWCRAGIATTIDITPELADSASWDDFPGVQERLIQGEMVTLWINELPEPSCSEFTKQGIIAMTLVPILVQEKFWGVFGFDYCAEVPSFDTAQQAIFTIAVGSIAAAIERQAKNAELRLKEQAAFEAQQEKAARLASMNEALLSRERLLETVATAANALLTIDNFDDAVNSALQIIGESLDTDRVSVIDHFDSSQGFTEWRLLYEWDSFGTISQISHPTLVKGSNKEIESSNQLLSQGKTVSWLLEDMPEPFRSGQAELGVKSLHVIPIFVEGKFWGSVGFDDCITYRTWTQQEIDVLTAAADSIGAALHRKLLVERLVEERLKAERERVTQLTLSNISLKAANQKIIEQEQEKATLFSISKTIATVRDKQDLLRLIIEKIKPIFNFYDCGVLMLDKQGEYYIDLAALHPEIDNSEANNNLYNKGIYQTGGTVFKGSMLEQIIQQLEKANSPFVFDYQKDYIGYSDSDVLKIVKDFGNQEGLSALLKAGGKIFGCFIINSLEKNFFKSEQFALFQGIADQLAVAVANIIANEEIGAHEKARAAELAKTNDILQHTIAKLSTTPDLNSYLEHVLNIVANEWGACSNALFLYNETTGMLLQTVMMYDETALDFESDERMQLWRHPIEAEITPAWHLVNETFGIAITDIYPPDPAICEFSLPWHREMEHISLLWAPLRIGECVKGFMRLGFRQKVETVTEEKIALTQTLAHQIITVLELSRLSEEAKHEAQQSAVLEERNRMAREIHDTLAQSFTGISMQVKAAKLMANTEPLSAWCLIDNVNELASQGLAEARRSVWSLHPDADQYQEFIAALRRSLTEMTVNTSIETTLEVEGTPYPLPCDVGRNLLKVAQEAVTNSLRHAQCTTIAVKVFFNSKSIILHIQDNGHGFETAPNLDQGGFGLSSMQQRCTRMGGTFELISQPGEGTIIMIEVPV